MPYVEPLSGWMQEEYQAWLADEERRRQMQDETTGNVQGAWIQALLPFPFGRRDFSYLMQTTSVLHSIAQLYMGMVILSHGYVRDLPEEYSK